MSRLTPYIVGTPRLALCLFVIIPVGIVLMALALAYEWPKARWKRRRECR